VGPLRQAQADWTGLAILAGAELANKTEKGAIQQEAEPPRMTRLNLAA